jgi:hypothetical protein
MLAERFDALQAIYDTTLVIRTPWLNDHDGG